MKKFFMMVALAILTLGTAVAQENGNRDKDGNVVCGPYLTNGFFDNTFIGIGGGVNTFAADGVKFLPIKPGIEAEAFIGKWYTPSIGTRIGYKGITNIVNGGNEYWQHYVHGDFMWNLSNALGGYKETRFWDVVPYATVGAYDLLKRNGWKNSNYEYGAGAGIYNKMRLNDRVCLYLDINTLIVRANAYTKVHSRFGFVPSASFGVVFNIGEKTGFKRYSSEIAKYYPFSLTDYNDAVRKNRKYEEMINVLENENKELRDAVDSLNTIKPEVIEVVKEVNVNEVSVYFEIGQYVISEKELSHIEDFVTSVDKDRKLKIIGSADSKEGTEQRNAFLSAKRAEVVKNILVEKYGFNPENITVETMIDVADTPERSRVAIVL